MGSPSIPTYGVTWLPALADRYHIVRMDLRGFGRSFVPAKGEAWSIDAMVRDVRDVLAAVGVERVHFVGESTGGTVGLHLAAHHPACLLTLTMVSAAHRGGHDRQIAGAEGRRAKAGHGRVVGNAHAAPVS